MTWRSNAPCYEPRAVRRGAIDPFHRACLLIVAAIALGTAAIFLF
jgi:hypothetical protein